MLYDMYLIFPRARLGSLGDSSLRIGMTGRNLLGQEHCTPSKEQTKTGPRTPIIPALWPPLLRGGLILGMPETFLKPQ